MNTTTIIIFIIVGIIFANCQNPLDSDDYEYMLALVNKIGDINAYNYNAQYKYYDFCASPFLTCENQKITEFLEVKQKNQVGISGNDFIGFSSLNYLYLKNENTLANNFFSTWPPNFEILVIETNRITGMLFGKPPSTLKTIEFHIEIQPTIITYPFSWFKNVTNLVIGEGSQIITDTSHLIYFYNDLTSYWKDIIYCSMISMIFPSFEKVVNSNIYISLNPGFDQSSLVDNIHTISSLTSIKIKTSEIIDFPINLNQEIMPSEIVFSTRFKKPVEFIDLSKLGAVSLKLLDVGTTFSIDGKLPIILSNLITGFEFSKGNITKLDKKLFSNYKYLNYLSITSSLITDTLPSTWDKSSSIKTLNLVGNQISGTLDKSYCSLDIQLASNLLTGDIPTCFTCFFNKVTKERFKNNLFTNFDSPPECTTIIPNIVYNRYVEPNHYLYIFGQDLGLLYDTSLQYPDQQFGCIVEVQSSLLQCTYSGILNPPPRTFNLIYTLPTTTQLTYTLSWDPLPPQLISVDWTIVSELVIIGSFFSYNSTVIEIIVGGTKCNIETTTFYQIKCTFSDPFDTTKQDIISNIKVDKLITQFTLNPTFVNQILNCTKDYNDCNGNGYCVSSIGECNCNARYAFPDCSTCLSEFQGEDCMLQFKQCPKYNSLICNGQGNTCNNQTGICSCIENKWFGPDCSIPYHFINSIIPSTINGGNASFIGYFGTVHEGLSIKIGGLDCPVSSISSNIINCSAPIGSGIKSVVISQNGIDAQGVYKYEEIFKSCPNFCSNRGECDTSSGQCICYPGYGSFDCSAVEGIPPKTNTTIDEGTGGTEIINQEISFKIYFKSLLELDFNNNIIKNYTLLNNWSFNTTNQTTDKVYTLSQTIDNGCSIISNIEEVTYRKEYSFANSRFILNAGDVKFTISINNYNYQSNLNTLKLELISTVDQLGSTSDCNSKKTEINSFNTDDHSPYNYIKISKNNKILSGRIINTLISDGTPTYYSTTTSSTDDSIILSFNLPHCVHKCLIDPDFSMLVDPDFKSCDESNRKWVIPVAIVVSVVGVAIISISLFLIFKKYSTSIKVAAYKLKRYDNQK